jgi:hypothetical protein
MEQELLIFSEYLTHFCFIVVGCCLTIIFLCSILSNVVVLFFLSVFSWSLYCLSFDELRLLITPFDIFKLILVYHYCWIISILRLPCVCWHDITVVVVELSPFMLYASFVVYQMWPALQENVWKDTLENITYFTSRNYKLNWNQTAHYDLWMVNR